MSWWEQKLYAEGLILDGKLDINSPDGGPEHRGNLLDMDDAELAGMGLRVGP